MPKPGAGQAKSGLQSVVAQVHVLHEVEHVSHAGEVHILELVHQYGEQVVTPAIVMQVGVPMAAGAQNPTGVPNEEGQWQPLILAQAPLEVAPLQAFQAAMSSASIVSLPAGLRAEPGKAQFGEHENAEASGATARQPARTATTKGMGGPCAEVGSAGSDSAAATGRAHVR